MAIRLESGLAGLREALAAARSEGRSIGFVPTMGFLHRGHQSLIEQSAGDGHFTIVSIFINPAQFGPNEDLDTYPRDEEGDWNKCISSGANLVWYPSREDLYPAGSETMVSVGPLAQMLCGLSRPAFFGGICSVVLKFFNLIQPQVAYFGEKDYQQLTIIRRMVADFYLDVDVRGGETVREPDGLAMSSRNARLKPEQREHALTFWRCISEARIAFAAGERDAHVLFERLRGLWPESLKFDYMDFRNPRTLEPVQVLAADTRIFLGGWLDGVRLIDNARIG